MSLEQRTLIHAIKRGSSLTHHVEWTWNLHGSVVFIQTLLSVFALCVFAAHHLQGTALVGLDLTIFSHTDTCIYIT